MNKIVYIADPEILAIPIVDYLEPLVSPVINLDGSVRGFVINVITPLRR